MVSERDNLTVLIKIPHVIPNILHPGLSISVNVVLHVSAVFDDEIYLFHY